MCYIWCIVIFDVSMKLPKWSCFGLWKAIRTLTHWGRVAHICASKLTIINSDNGFSPGRRQAIIGTNAGILLVRPLGTNFSEISEMLNSDDDFVFRHRVNQFQRVNELPWGPRQDLRPACLQYTGSVPPPCSMWIEGPPGHQGSLCRHFCQRRPKGTCMS